VPEGPAQLLGIAGGGAPEFAEEEVEQLLDKAGLFALGALSRSPSSASRLFRFLVLAGLAVALLHPAAAGCARPSRPLVLLGLEPNWAFPPDGQALIAINLGLLNSYKPTYVGRVTFQLESCIFCDLGKRQAMNPSPLRAGSAADPLSDPKYVDGLSTGVASHKPSQDSDQQTSKPLFPISLCSY